MPRCVLTIGTVERIQPPASGRAEHWDLELPGFGLRVSESGKKSWVLMRRLHGRLTRYTLGTYPDLGVPEARDLAREAIRRVARGEDPRSDGYGARPDEAASHGSAPRRGSSGNGGVPWLSSQAAVFVGRTAELRELYGAIDAALATRGAAILLRGEPGAGKTSLAERVAATAAKRGALVAWGRCGEGDGMPAFLPWAQALRTIVGDRSVDEVLPPAARRERELLEAIIDLRAAAFAGADDLATPERSRFLLFDAVVRMLRRESLRQPIVLVLDDLHWADVASLLLFRFLAERIAESRILALGLHRDVSHDGRASAASRVVAELATKIPLVGVDGFSDGEIGTLFEARCGRQAGERLVRSVAWASGRNAFFVDEIIRALAVGAADRAVLDAGPVPVTDRARDAVRRRVESLPGDARAVLRAASVLGHSFHFEPLAELLGLPGGEVARSLERLRSVHLLHPDPDDPGRDRFAHAIFRDGVYGDVPPLERAALHRRAAEILEGAAAAGGRKAPLAEVAHHWWGARPAGEGLEKARRYTIRAAEAARSLLAWEEAAELYQRAVESAPAGDTLEMADLLLAWGDVLWRAGDLAEARAVFERAAAVARRLGDGRLLARAALGRGDGFGAAYVSYGPDPVLVALLEEALTALPGGDDPLRVRCLARLEVALYRSGTPASIQTALSHHRAALAMAERLGDPSLRLIVLFYHQCARIGLDSPLERLAATDGMLPLGIETGASEVVYWQHYFRLTAALDTGDFGAFTRELGQCEALNRELPLPMLQWRTGTLRAMRAILEGSLAEAEAEAEVARDLGERSESDVVYAAHATQMVAIRWLQGRLAEVEPEIRAGSDRFLWTGAWRAGLAWLYAETGRMGDARAELGRINPALVVAKRRQGSLGMTTYYLAMVTSLLEDRRLAEQLYAALLPFADRHSNSGTMLVSWGSASMLLGILAATLGRFDAADEHFRAGLAANMRLGNRPAIAFTLREHAAALLRRDAPGDRAEAARMLGEGLRLMREHGFAGLIARALVLEREAQADETSGAYGPIVQHAIRREGDYWTIRFFGEPIRLRDTKGVRYIDYLIARPGVEVHAMDLASEPRQEPQGAERPRPKGRELAEMGASLHAPLALEALDGRARRELGARAKELEHELAEAEARNDLGRAIQLRQELGFVMEHVAAAYGLGGRPRFAADPAERARKAVCERIRGVIARIDKENTALGRYLTRSIRTGAFCAFTPERDEIWVR